MAQNARIGDEWIQSAERIQVAATKSDEADLEQYVSVSEDRISDGLQISLARFAKHKRSHVCTWGKVIGKVIDVNHRSSGHRNWLPWQGSNSGSMVRCTRGRSELLN
jgi:hypothetical protein